MTDLEECLAVFAAKKVRADLYEHHLRILVGGVARLSDGHIFSRMCPISFAIFEES